MQMGRGYAILDFRLGILDSVMLMTNCFQPLICFICNFRGVAAGKAKTAPANLIELTQEAQTGSLEKRHESTSFSRSQAA
jgi:hypothetical protein